MQIHDFLFESFFVVALSKGQRRQLSKKRTFVSHETMNEQNKTKFQKKQSKIHENDTFKPTKKHRNIKNL